MTATTPLHVLCAIEPNNESADTVSIAANFAKSSGGDLTLMHVVAPMWQPYADLNFTPVIEAQVSLEKDLMKAASEHLRTLADNCGATCKDVIVQQGQPAHDIAAQTKRMQDVLLVLGVHNRRGLRRLMGSTAHAVLNATTCPILLTHADDRANAQYDNIVVAVDTSSAISDVLAHAAPFIAQAKQTTVVSIVPSLATTMGSLNGSAFASTWPMADMQTQMLDATKTSVTEATQNAGINATAIQVIEGSPAHEICTVAESSGADLIVMGSGKRNIIDRILLGSTAHGVLNATPCDVYIARD